MWHYIHVHYKRRPRPRLLTFELCVQKYVVDGGISLNFPVVDTVLWRMAAVEGTVCNR